MSLLLLLVLVSLISYSHCHNCRGCTPLVNVTFDKMIQTFPASLIKFDVFHPYGQKHDEFAKVALDAAESMDLLVAEVGVKDYGEKDNEDLANRFKITKEDFPVVIMFVNKKDEIMSENRFSGEEFSSESLKNFVRQHSGIHLPVPGCVEVMDLLADRMMQGKKEEWGIVKEQAEAEVTKMEDKKSGNIYVKIMGKIIAEGEEFVAKEIQRTKKMKEGKVSEQKKEDLQQKINILRSFSVNGKAVKEEL